MEIKDITGQTFGRWTVIKFYDKVIYTYPNGTFSTVPRWLCRCECGNEKVVRGLMLKNGSSKSCGCYQQDFQRERKTTHGQFKSPEYAAWAHMMDRCRNPRNRAYKDYGGRGITVCDRWLIAANFLTDMGPRPTPKHTLERQDNERGYGPDNCVWATQPEQQNNKRVNRRLRFNGRVQTLTQWAEELGIDRSRIWNRLNDGWTTAEALTIPVDSDPTGWNVRRLRHG